MLADNSAAILVVSTERAGKDLSLPERARRLLADIERPAAIFSADGELIDAKPAARQRFGGKLDLAALGAEKLAREASLNGQAGRRHCQAGRVAMLRLGAGATHDAAGRFRRAKSTEQEQAENRREPSQEAGQAPIIADRATSGGCRSRLNRPHRTAARATAVPLRLADGRGDALYPRRREFRSRDRAEDRGQH